MTSHLWASWRHPSLDSPHKGQWRGFFSMICVWTNGWANNRDAGDLRCRRTNYDVTVMAWLTFGHTPLNSHHFLASGLWGSFFAFETNYVWNWTQIFWKNQLLDSADSNYNGVFVNFVMTSSNVNIFRVTGPLRGKFTGDRWIPLTKASDAELWCFFICAWINCWVNNRDAGDWKHHRAHYDVTLMLFGFSIGYAVLLIRCQHWFRKWPFREPIKIQFIDNICSEVIMSAMASQITGISIAWSTVCSGVGQRIHQSSYIDAFSWYSF